MRVWTLPRSSAPGAEFVGFELAPRGGPPAELAAATMAGVLGKVGRWRHVVVGASIALTSGLAGLGVIGGGHPERFDAKTVVVARDGASALRITEYVDIDFGDEERRGYRRLVPDDFGAPTDVIASSPDADDTVTVISHSGYTEIRIGDPDETFTGQHRYVLAYTLPDAHYEAPEFTAEYGSGSHLVVDLVSAPGGVYEGDNETLRFEAIVTGYLLDPAYCDVGDVGDEGGCTLTGSADGTFRVVLEPLEADAGLTVGGRIVAFTESVEVAAPPIPERRGDGPNRWLVALGFVGIGLLGAVPVYRWARHRGRNEIYAGGATDAAFGALPQPGTEVEALPVHLVADDDLGDLATIEFTPPKGLDPWEAQVLITEQCDNGTVEAWLSGLAGQGAVELDEQGGALVIQSGDTLRDLDADDARLLDAILQIDDPYVTGEYDPAFAKAWSEIHDHQTDRIARSGWWKSWSPGSGPRLKAGRLFGVLAIVLFSFFWVGAAATAVLGVFDGWLGAIALGLLLPAVIALFMYAVLLPARTARGSALALQAESFRRFLHASEGRHVEWAWSHGLLREYSAWAVALGEAEAWSSALERANVPEPARAVAAPLFVSHYSSSISQSRVAPSSSGSNSGGGGGGFGGGGSGGGGGGGSSGSW